MQFLTRSDEARPVEDYMCEYLTKILEMRLESAASAILEAMNHIQETNIQEPDTGN